MGLLLACRGWVDPGRRARCDWPARVPSRRSGILSFGCFHIHALPDAKPALSFFFFLFSFLRVLDYSVCTLHIHTQLLCYWPGLAGLPAS